MSNNQKRVLDMLAEKKISVDEAQRLLALLEPGDEPEKGVPEETTGRKAMPKYLRVVVQPGAEAGASGDRVNIRVPISLIRAGMKITSLIPDHASADVNEALREHGINFDIKNMKPEDLDELLDALEDLEIDVQGGREKIRVYME